MEICRRIKNYLCKIGLHDYRCHIYMGCKPVEFKNNGITYGYFKSISRSEIRCCRCGKKGTSCALNKPNVLVGGLEE